MAVIYGRPDKGSCGLRGKRGWGYRRWEKTDRWDHHPAQHWGPEQQPDVPLAVLCNPWAVMWGVSKAWGPPRGKARILSMMLLACSGSQTKGPLPSPLFRAALGQHWASTTRRTSLHHPEFPTTAGCVSSHYSLAVLEGLL